MKIILAGDNGVNIGKQFGSPFDNLGELVSALLPNLYILAGIIALLLLIGGGFSIIINAGQGQKEGVAKGQKAITAGVIGFIIIIGSYWIVQIISTITGLNILNPEL